jgi:Restriction Enzyme Adenine Methylase Associated
LTDGNEYRFYNAPALVDAEEKLFCQIRLTDTAEEDVANTLNLISRSNLEENILDVLWTAHFVDRRVKDTLRRMLDSKDRGLVRLIRRRVPKLTPKEILQSLGRLDVQIESASAPLATPAKPPEPGLPAETRKKLQEAGRKAAVARRLWSDVALSDLIAAGLLAAPMRLFRKYKGQTIEAKLLPDGKVEFGGKQYDSCSTAAEIARGTVTGRRMHTNGWIFWQWTDKDGNKRTLFDARKRFAAMKNKKSSPS